MTHSVTYSDDRVRIQPSMDADGDPSIGPKQRPRHADKRPQSTGNSAFPGAIIRTASFCSSFMDELNKLAACKKKKSKKK